MRILGNGPTVCKGSQIMREICGGKDFQKDNIVLRHISCMKLKFQPGTERVQALADISRSALYAVAMYKAISLHCYHSNETRAPIANSANGAQLVGTSYHFPKLHPGPCSSVGMRRGTDRDTDRQIHRVTDCRDHYSFRVVYDSREMY